MKKKTFRNILAIFLLILMLFFALGLIVRFAGNKTVTSPDKDVDMSTPDSDINNPSKPPVEEDKSVVLALNGNVLSSGQYIGLSNGVNKFVVKNAKEYTASVCFAKGISDFDFLLDGSYETFFEKDLKTAFNVTITDTGFSIDIPADMYTMISRVYDGEEIVFSSDFEFSEMFFLKVLADNVTYEIPFKISSNFNILLNCERIVLL